MALRVSRFESNLLTILQFAVRRTSAARALPLICEFTPKPQNLQRDTIRLVADTLAKGCISVLAQAGGWWNDRYLHDGCVKTGPVWRRYPPDRISLSFSRHVLKYLIWLTQYDPLRDDKKPPVIPVSKLTPADQFFFWLTYFGLRHTQVGEWMRRRKLYSDNPLCRLTWPADFADQTWRFDFVDWVHPPFAAIIESLQGEFADAWLGSEQQKKQCTNWRKMQAVGRSQQKVLSSFLDVLAAHERLDLARFLLRVLNRALTSSANADWWLHGLPDRGPRIADRTETVQSALALIRHVHWFKQWEQRCRTIGYFDDGYAAAQLFLSDWEVFHGDVMHERAQRILDSQALL